MGEPTKGPWVARQARSVPAADWIIEPKGGWEQCHSIDNQGFISLRPRYNHAEEDEANARLIASAPDLLAACEAFSEAIHDGYPGKMLSALELVEVALEKARGNA